MKGAAHDCNLRRTFLACRLRLEIKFQAQLQDARIARADNACEGSRRERRSHAIEIGVIENIERLEAELQVGAFADVGIFEERDIPSLSAGPGDGAARSIAESVIDQQADFQMRRC